MLKLETNNRLPDLDTFYITGELALSGQLRPVKGVLSIALEAWRRQGQTLIVPFEDFGKEHYEGEYYKSIKNGRLPRGSGGG